jgi:hypothetical protein
VLLVVGNAWRVDIRPYNLPTLRFLRQHLAAKPIATGNIQHAIGGRQIRQCHLVPMQVLAQPRARLRLTGMALY